MNNSIKNNIILLEENARQLYLDFSKICDDRIVNTMISFSMQEENHKKIINTFFELEITNRDLNSKILEIIDQQQNFYKSNISLHKDKEFFVFALEIEKKSIETYEKCLALFEPDTKNFNIFKDMIAEEKNHMIYILKIIHSL